MTRFEGIRSRLSALFFAGAGIALVAASCAPGQLDPRTPPPPPPASISQKLGAGYFLTAPPKGLDLPGIALVVGLALLYRIPLEARLGQTIGKKMMGISVYGPQGGVPGWWRSIARNAIGIIVPLWLVDVAFVLAGRRRQRLGDLASRTTIRRVAH